MNFRHATLAVATLPALLVSCGNGDASSAEPAAVEPLAEATTRSDVPDAMIRCAMRDFDGASGLTVTETFLVIDGEVLRYAESQNGAFALCAPGQEDCRLGFVGNTIVMDWTSPSGTGTSYAVDLDTLEITAQRTEDGVQRTVDFADGSLCESSSLPEGLQRL